MDLVVVDITHLQGLAPQEGHWMEVIGVHQSADQLAASWGTIGLKFLRLLGLGLNGLFFPYHNCGKETVGFMT